MASEAHRHILQDYKAGLWLGDLSLGLLWSAPGPGAVNIAERLKFYAAPSWSWASIDFSMVKPARFPFDTPTIYERQLVNYPPSQCVSRVISADVLTFRQHSFGRPVNGALKMEGPCQQVCLYRVPGSFKDCYVGNNCPAIHQETFVLPESRSSLSRNMNLQDEVSMVKVNML
jgi:hypothetical protein